MPTDARSWRSSSKSASTTTDRLQQHPCGGAAHEPFLRGQIEQSLGDRFLAQVERHGACLAIGDGDLRVTYADLERWSRAVGEHLIAVGVTPVGVTPASRVALLLDQGATVIAATLGTLRAGAVYVPLDPGEPDTRLETLIARVEASAIVTDAGSAERVRRLAPDTPVVLADDEESPAEMPLPVVAPDAPAYIYFTSGSSGQPKGVLDRHRNVLHNVMRYTNALRIGPRDRLSLVQAPAFSGVISSTFAALLNGAAVFPYRLDSESLGSLAAWLRRERITIYHSVPSILRSALVSADVLPDVRVVRLEGDRSYGQDMATWRRHFQPETLIANGLGTTEAGLCRQFVVPIETKLENGIMPVGYEVADMDVAIVDQDGRSLENGVAGEISVSSPYLATGYWADEQLTASVFTPTAGKPGWRTYRTGDLGRLRPDGCLEYLGRRDGLSKVLGHRVEPAEIEAALAAIPGVQAAAVRIVKARRGEGRVVAYVVPPGLDESALREAAARCLPAYMRPSEFIAMPVLPLGPNGKVDRAALPGPDEARVSGASPPSDQLEARVAAIVATVLEHPIERDDDFFLSGGDSMAAVDLLLALEQETRGRLPPSLVVRAPTVAALTAELRAAPVRDLASLYPLASTGEGLPLVLVPSHYGHALSYALLARRLEAIRPVWALEAGTQEEQDVSVEAIANRYAEALHGARFSSPFLLGGFCYGGVVAFELARQLIETGADVAGLYLLGVSPHDFPGLMSREARERWSRSRTPAGYVRRAIRFAAGVATPEGRGYVTMRMRSRTGMLQETLSSGGRARRRARARRSSGARATYGQYRSAPLASPVAVILPEWSLGDDPIELASFWTGIASSVVVRVVPGVERMMLSEPVVSSVAEILARDPATATPKDRATPETVNPT